MKSLLIIGLNPKDQYRTKSFLEKDYHVEAKASMHDGVEHASQKKFDLFLYDVDNAVPLKFFHQELKKNGISTPIVVLSRKIEMSQLRELRALGVVSLVKKAYSKRQLLKGVHNGFKNSQFLTKDNADNKEYTISNPKADILLGLKQNAVISKIRENGLNMLLPTSLDLGTRMNFSNTDLCDLIGYAYTTPPRIEMIVRMCAPIADYQFKVDASFSNNIPLDFKNSLRDYIKGGSNPKQIASETKTILIADVDKFSRDFYESSLKKLNYRILWAYDGFQVLDMLEEEKVHLVVLDLSLPKLNGQEVIALMQKRKIQVPIVVATGETNPMVVKRVRPHVDEYLIKPFKGQEFAIVIQDVLKQAQATSAKKAEASSVKIHLKTNLFVVFRDQIRLLRASEQGLVFLRQTPIAPGTKLLLKTKAIQVSSQNSQSNDPSFNIMVVKCERHKQRPIYIVYTSFF